MPGGISAAIPVCGETLASACGTTADDDGTPYTNNPYDCKGCDSVTIFDDFVFDRSLAVERPGCQGVFGFPVDYGDVYYRGDGRVYDAWGEFIGTQSACVNRSINQIRSIQSVLFVRLFC